MACKKCGARKHSPHTALPIFEVQLFSNDSREKIGVSESFTLALEGIEVSMRVGTVHSLPESVVGQLMEVGAPVWRLK